MIWTAAALLLLAAAPGEAATREPAPARNEAPLRAEAVFYYDRGHYWIEVAFLTQEGRDSIPADIAASRFTIAGAGGEGGAFHPSRAETASDGARRYVLLSSSRLEGRACYRLIYAPAAGETVAVDSICDPFAGTDASETRPGGRWRRAVAGLFARGEDPWRLNSLSFEHELSLGRSSMRLAVEPRLRARGWRVEGALRLGESSAALSGGSMAHAGRQDLSLGVSKAGWSHRMRFAAAAACRLERAAWEGAAGDSSLASWSAALEWRVRLDDLLDAAGVSPWGVLKGVELAFGYELHGRAGEGETGRSGFERIAPFSSARATWTVLDALQLSYSIESHWPDALGESPAAFRCLRARLLLRDEVERPPGKAYHPDVELAWDAGRRPPLFRREERVSLGFAFDLYPR